MVATTLSRLLERALSPEKLSESGTAACGRAPPAALALPGNLSAVCAALHACLLARASGCVGVRALHLVGRVRSLNPPPPLTTPTVVPVRARARGAFLLLFDARFLGRSVLRGYRGAVIIVPKHTLGKPGEKPRRPGVPRECLLGVSRLPVSSGPVVRLTASTPPSALRRRSWRPPPFSTG